MQIIELLFVCVGILRASLDFSPCFHFVDDDKEFVRHNFYLLMFMLRVL